MKHIGTSKGCAHKSLWSIQSNPEKQNNNATLYFIFETDSSNAGKIFSIDCHSQNPRTNEKVPLETFVIFMLDKREVSTHSFTAFIVSNIQPIRTF
jgi:hypothetical protein